MTELQEFCVQNPSRCAIGGGDVLTGGSGTDFFIVPGAPFAIEAEPRHPGIHGDQTCRIGLTGVVECFPTPGAASARETAFRRIFVAAVETAMELLALDAGAPGSVVAYLQGSSAGSDVLQLVDGNADLVVSPTDFYEFPGAFPQSFDGLDPALGEPLHRLLELVALELKLDLLTAAEAAEPRLGLANLARGLDVPLFSLTSTCSLIRACVTDDRVAERLCGLLRDARSGRGDQQLRSRFLRALESEINRTLTRRHYSWVVRILPVIDQAAIFSR